MQPMGCQPNQPCNVGFSGQQPQCQPGQQCNNQQQPQQPQFNYQLPECTFKCTFPNTTLSLTTANEIPVGHVLNSNATLTFWLNYTCPTGVTVRNIRRPEGISVGRHAFTEENQDTKSQGPPQQPQQQCVGPNCPPQQPQQQCVGPNCPPQQPQQQCVGTNCPTNAASKTNTSDAGLSGGFFFKMWGILDFVGKEANYEVALEMDNCVQPAVKIPFLTTNPLGFSKGNWSEGLPFSEKDCMNDLSLPSSAFNVVPGGASAILPFNTTEYLHIEVTDVSYEFQDLKNPNNRLRQIIKVQSSGEQTQDGISISGMPISTMYGIKRDVGKTTLGFKIGAAENNMKLRGKICMRMTVEDGLTAPITRYVGINLNSDGSVFGTGSSATSMFSFVKTTFAVIGASIAYMML
jgi:hypothetical protein